MLLTVLALFLQQAMLGWAQLLMVRRCVCVCVCGSAVVFSQDLFGPDYVDPQGCARALCGPRADAQPPDALPLALAVPRGGAQPLVFLQAMLQTMRWCFRKTALVLIVLLLWVTLVLRMRILVLLAMLIPVVIHLMSVVSRLIFEAMLSFLVLFQAARMLHMV